MLEIMRRLGTATSSLHRGMKETVDAVGEFLVDAFHYLALFAIGATTVWSAAAAFIGMAARGHASLGDILLLFIYLEIGAMVGIYFKTTRLPVRYLIYVAITALGRVLIGPRVPPASWADRQDAFGTRCGGARGGSPAPAPYA